MSRLERVDNWPILLSDYLTSVRKKPLVWGEHDCVLFSLTAASILTGIDVTCEFRGKYSNAIGAAKLMAKLFGVTSLTEAANSFGKRFDAEEVLVSFAQRGDIVEAEITLPEGGTAPALGIVDLDSRYALFVSEQGLVRYLISDCKRAWKI